MICATKVDLTIKSVHAREILDGKARPLLEVDVTTEGGVVGRATAPSGISTGGGETVTLRDGDAKWYRGDGVSKAIAHVNGVIQSTLRGQRVNEQEAIDEALKALDDSPGYALLGGNAIYGASLACLEAARSAAQCELFEYLAGGDIMVLPFPITHCFYSWPGVMQVQECGFVPYKAANMREAAHILAAIYRTVPEVLKDRLGHMPQRHPYTSWMAVSNDPFAAFSIIREAAERCEVANKIAYIADFAANDIYDAEADAYVFCGEKLPTEAWIRYLASLSEAYPFLYMEDPIREDDWAGWEKASAEITRTALIGDDLTVTNAKNVQRALDGHACGGIVFKPNQVGTVTDSLLAARLAQKNGMLVIPSVRSGETSMDPTAEFGIGLGCCAVKSGPPGEGRENHCLSTLLRAADMYPDAAMADLENAVRF